MTRLEKKQQFIKQLAHFLCGKHTAMTSIELEMGKPSAKQWADLRQTTPIFGWLTEKEGEKVLTDFLM